MEKFKVNIEETRILNHELVVEAEDSINNQNDNSASDPSTQSSQQQYQPEDPQQQYQQLPQKRNMRDAVDFSRYGFRMY